MRTVLKPDEEVGFIAAVNIILGGSWTDKGVTAWWRRSRPQLDGRTPYEAMQSGDLERVVKLALGGIMGGGT